MRKIAWFALSLIVAVAALSSLPQFTAAQGANLLQNPGLEKPYNGQGAPDQTAPVGWSFWASIPGVTSFPHIDPAQIHGGASAWNIRKGGAPFSGGGWQQVPGIQLGSTLHASMFAQAYTCNDTVHSCIGNDGKHHSDISSGAYFKIGIDPSGGTDPAASTIVWSAPQSSFDAWAQIAVDAVNCNNVVTVFLFATQSTGMFINAVYFDDTSLTVTTPGTGTTVTCGATTPGSTSAPVPTVLKLAPFVTKQAGEQPDGSIIHTVVAGDTLAAIAVAYGVTLDELRALNNIKPGDNLLVIGQKIIVRAPRPPTATVGAIALAPTIAPVVLAPTNGPIAGTLQIPRDLRNPTAMGDHAGVAQQMIGRATVFALLAVLLMGVGSLRPIAAQSATTGSVCALAFDDANKNSAHDAGEAVALGVNESLLVKGNIVIANHLSDGQGQYCFNNLLPGQYTLTFASPLIDATTPNSFVIGVNAGDQVVREFGGTVRLLTVSTSTAIPPPKLTQVARIALASAGAILAMLFMVGLRLIGVNFYRIVRRR